MRPEHEIESLLTELQAAADVTDLQRRLDRGRLVGTIAMVSLLEWVLGASDDKVRESLVKLAQMELREAVRFANRPGGKR